MSLIKWRRNGGLLPSVAPLTDWIDNFYGDDESFVNRWLNRPSHLPAVNIRETDEAYNLEMAVPGMKKEDFKVEVEKGLLYISAETKTEKEEDTEGYTRKEFSYSTFNRSFWLPENVNAENIAATYEDGMLKVMLPKTEVEAKKPAKRIAVA